MVLVSYSGREINAKLVYYGPGLSGKTTNLEAIYAAVPQSHRGKMVSMKTKTERTLFFDFLPIQLGELAGFKTRFLLYTVPGQVYYNATRKLVLKGVDAIVFVADSKRGKMDENVESLQNLRDNLKEHGLDLDRIPWVIQYNKRDMPDTYSLDELERVLNPQRKVPSFEAVATSGQGVIETFKAISRLLLKHLSREIGVRVVEGADETRASETSSTRTPPAPPAQTVVLAAAEPRLEPVPAEVESPVPLSHPDTAPRSAVPFEVERFGPSARPATPIGGDPGGAGTVDPRAEGVGSRLRRWFARTPEQENSTLRVEPLAEHAPTAEPETLRRGSGMPVHQAIPDSIEPVRLPQMPAQPPVQQERRAEGAGDRARAPRPGELFLVSAQSHRVAEGAVEIPLEVDVDPDDLARGVTLKIVLRSRRPASGEGTEEDRSRAA